MIVMVAGGRRTARRLWRGCRRGAGGMSSPVAVIVLGEGDARGGQKPRQGSGKQQFGHEKSPYGRNPHRLAGRFATPRKREPPKGVTVPFPESWGVSYGSGFPLPDGSCPISPFALPPPRTAL